MHAMLNGGNFSSFLRNSYWKISLFQQFCGRVKRSILTSLQKFGETCILTNCDNSHWSKIANWDIDRIWLDFAYGNQFNTYQVLNPKTSNICLFTGMTFFNKTCGKWDKVDKWVLFPLVMNGQMWKALKRFLKK